MPVKLAKNVFGNPRTRVRQKVVDAVENKGLTKATRRAHAVVAGKRTGGVAARSVPGAGGGRPGGADWYRVEDINVNRKPVTDTLVRTPVTDRQIVEHRGMSAPLSAWQGAKLAGSVVGAGTAANIAVKGAAFLAKKALRNVPVVGPLMRLGSVGRTAYKLNKAYKAGQKISKAQAVRALITSGL